MKREGRFLGGFFIEGGEKLKWAIKGGLGGRFIGIKEKIEEGVSKGKLEAGRGGVGNFLLLRVSESSRNNPEKSWGQG